MRAHPLIQSQQLIQTVCWETPIPASQAAKKSIADDAINQTETRKQGHIASCSAVQFSSFSAMTNAMAAININAAKDSLPDPVERHPTQILIVQFKLIDIELPSVRQLLNF